MYKIFKDTFEGMENETFTTQKIKELILTATNYKYHPDSIIPSDFCYNRINKGIDFKLHLFEYKRRGFYIYRGENKYRNEDVWAKIKRNSKDIKVGKWQNGTYKLKDKYKDIYPKLL